MYNRDSRWLQVTISQLLWLLQTTVEHTQWLYWWLFYTIIQQPLCQTEQQLTSSCCMQPLCKTKQQLHLVAPLCHRPDSKFKQIWFCHFRLEASSAIFMHLYLIFKSVFLFVFLWHFLTKIPINIYCTVYEHCLFEVRDRNESSTSYTVIEWHDSPHVWI